MSENWRRGVEKSHTLSENPPCTSLCVTQKTFTKINKVLTIKSKSFSLAAHHKIIFRNYWLCLLKMHSELREAAQTRVDTVMPVLQGILVLSVLGSNPTWFPLLGPVTLDSDVVLELSDWPWVPALPKITNFRFSLGCKCCSPMISPDSPPHQTKLLESPRIQESSCLVEEYRQNLF